MTITTSPNSISLLIADLVNFACEPYGLDPELIIPKNLSSLTDAIPKTIQNALELCTPLTPQWRYVAGRFLMASYNQKYSFPTILTNPTLQTHYSQKDLAFAFSQIQSDRDYRYDYAGAFLLTTRYLVPGENLQQVYMTIALLLATGVLDKGQRLTWAIDCYDAISLGKISLATPLLLNLRTPKGSLASCFIVSVDDTLISIFDAIKQIALISQHGGGAGICMSNLRSTGSWLRGVANAASGVVPWCKILNDTIVAVNQNGKRAGALTVALDCWHYDLLEFLDMQTEHGDIRRKAYDIFPQVVIPDLFMEYLESNQDWLMFDPYEVHTVLGIDLPSAIGDTFRSAYAQCVQAYQDKKLTLVKKVEAKQIWKLILRNQIETGLPYLAFKDTINQSNPNNHAGYIPCTNLCVESFSNVSLEEAHTCNLVSLNLSELQLSEIPQYSALAVEILDYAIDINQSFFPESRKHNEHYRTIGVGIMGLADYLAKNKLSYENLVQINTIIESISYYCIDASVRLAEIKGKYPLFEGSDWSKGILFGKTVAEIKENSTTKLDWALLIQRIKEHGIRNSQILAIAPNTSTSLVQGSSASFLPIYSKYYYDKFGKASVPILPKFNQYLAYYEENSQLDQSLIVAVTSTLQKWVDTGISMELLFNLNQIKDIREIADTIILAHKQGCKAVYYVRTIQDAGLAKMETKTCSVCAS